MGSRPAAVQHRWKNELFEDFHMQGRDLLAWAHESGLKVGHRCYGEGEWMMEPVEGTVTAARHHMLSIPCCHCSTGLTG